jgi:hypothetical protein
MKTRLKLVAAALMLGYATFSAAQTPTRAQSFSDQFKQMQSLSAQSDTYVFHTPAPTRRAADDPVGKESFANRIADLQAESSNSEQWTPEQQPTLTAVADDPTGKPAFSQTFAQLQAASSNSGEWAYPPGANVPADEANSTLVAGTAIRHVLSTPTFLSRK